MGWKEFLTVTGVSFLQAGTSIYIKTQAHVYIKGRMLGLFEKGKSQNQIDRSRNIVALFSTLIFTAGYLYSQETENQYFLYLWKFLDWFSMAIIIYVLLGFRLYSRIDTLLDKKVAKDKKGD